MEEALTMWSDKTNLNFYKLSEQDDQELDWIFEWSLLPYTTVQILICSMDIAVLLRKDSLHERIKDSVEMSILMTPSIKRISHREEGIYCGLVSTRLVCLFKVKLL